MPRKPRTFYAGAVCHVYFRGNQKNVIYRNESDYREYINRLGNLSLEEQCPVHSYSILPNHGHIIIEQASDNPISHMMQRLQGGFTQYWNAKYDSVGHVFQGRFKCILCTKEEYLLELIRYVHLNAPRAGIVSQPEDYIWSSHRDILNKDTNTFISQKFIKHYFTDISSYEKFVKAGLENNAKIRLINMAIETALRKNMTHPIPLLSEIAEKCDLDMGTSSARDVKMEFAAEAIKCGYLAKDVALYTGVCERTLYRMRKDARVSLYGSDP